MMVLLSINQVNVPKKFFLLSFLEAKSLAMSAKLIESGFWQQILGGLGPSTFDIGGAGPPPGPPGSYSTAIQYCVLALQTFYSSLYSSKMAMVMWLWPNTKLRPNAKFHNKEYSELCVCFKDAVQT